MSGARRERSTRKRKEHKMKPKSKETIKTAMSTEALETALKAAALKTAIGKTLAELIADNMDRIIATRASSAENCARVTLAVQIEPGDTLAETVVVARIAYGMRFTATARCVVDDPAQGKLDFDGPAGNQGDDQA
jgi:hypothetical protein